MKTDMFNDLKLQQFIKTNYLLIGAVITAFILRFFKYSTLPLPPNGDELAFGYYGWSILHFGIDEFGNRFPISFISIGDFKYPGLVYLNTIPALFFGLSELTVRFWNIISGVLLVLLVYNISLLFFKNKTSAIASSWFIALSPWSIIESRYGWENHISMVITTLGIYLLLFSLSKVKFKPKILIVVTVIFIFSTFTYGAQRIFIPAFLISLICILLLKSFKISNQHKQLFLILLAVSIFILIPALSNKNRGRIKEEIWKITAQDTNRLQELYVGAGTSPIRIPARITWFFHNKYRVAFTEFLMRYTNHFSPNFLFFYGEASNEKIPDMGLLSYYEILFLPIGLITLFKSTKKTDHILILLCWLFLAPVASSVTSGGPHINRSSLMIPLLAIISGWGFYTLTTIFKKWERLITIALIIIVIVNSLYSLNQIFIQKPLDKPWIKEQVYKSVVLDVLNLKSNYKAVAVGDNDYIYFLFYGGINPKDFIKKSDIVPLSDSNIWERVNRYDNIYFKMPFNCPKSGKLDVLYVCSGGEVPQNSKILKTYYFLDGAPAYTLLEFYPLSDLPKELPELPKDIYYMVDVENSTNFPDGIIPKDYPSLW